MSDAPAAPVFVVGLPRSGTTLLATMLDRHPRLAMMPETHYARLLGSLFGPPGPRRLRARRQWRRALAAGRLGEWVMGHAERDALAAAWQRGELTDHRRLFGAMIAAYAGGRGKERGGEKTPGHLAHLDLLGRAFPGALVVHVLRDPRDVCASLSGVPWGTDNPAWLVRVWRRHVVPFAARAAAADLHGLELRFEDLVADPAAQLARICAAAMLPPHEGMLEPGAPGNFDPAVAPWKRGASGSIDPAAVGRWRQVLAPGRAAYLERRLARAMTERGYACGPATPAAVLDPLRERLEPADRRLRRLRRRLRGAS